MKNTILIIATLLLISCNTKTDQKTEDNKSSQKEQVTTAETTDKNEKFEELNADELNTLLTDKKDITAKEVMKLFYPNNIATGEGNEKITLSETVSANRNTIVTLIHDNLLDDAVKANKYVMELTKNNNTWTVVSIKKNWKCWNGRGHTDWGIELCN